MNHQELVILPLLLKELLAEADDAANLPAVEVSGATADSRVVRPGEVFFALPGTATHGDAFAATAIDRGAVAIVSDRPIEGIGAVPVVLVDDVRAAFARAVARLFAPQPEILVGVTGTNGKTSSLPASSASSGRPAALPPPASARSASRPRPGSPPAR